MLANEYLHNNGKNLYSANMNTMAQVPNLEVYITIAYIRASYVAMDWVFGTDAAWIRK